MPRGNFSRSRMHAAATTGPASGAHPASSTPASGCGKSSSSLKEQRRGIGAKPMEPRRESPVGAWGFCGLVLDPPWREAPRFAVLVEEHDIAVRIAQPRLAPHPRLVPRAMFERKAAPRQLLDARVEVVAL